MNREYMQPHRPMYGRAAQIAQQVLENATRPLTLAEIMQRSGLREQTARDALAELCDTGYAVRERETRPITWRKREVMQ